MLVLTRRKDEQLIIKLGDETVVIRVLAVMRDRARLGIIADRSIAVHREEVARRIADWQKDLETLTTDAAVNTDQSAL